MTVSSESYRALVENSPDAISIINADGEVLYASAAAATVLGYGPEELLGRNGLDLLHPEDRDRSRQNFETVLAKPRTLNRMNARVRQKDGQWRWVEATSSNLLDVPGVGAIVVSYRNVQTSSSRDGFAQHLAGEPALANTELQAFAHSVAHDLREPLRSIAAFTQLLARNAHLSESDLRIASFVVDGVRRMSALLDALLTSATHSFNDSLRPVDLEHAAAEAIENLSEAIASSGASVTVHPLPAVLGNQVDLIRVFQNLIGNAVKYRGTAAPDIQITAEPCGADVVIRIRDNGRGIAKEHHRQVFGMFRRLDPQDVPGNGIGLAVCKRVVESLGGTIWVESEPGSGSTFCFTLAADYDTGAASEIHAGAEDVPGARRTHDRASARFLAPAVVNRVNGTQ